jgi:monoamine oxidase
MTLSISSIRLSFLSLVTSLLLACSGSNSNGTTSLTNVNCEISIIGGGPAGLYMAYQLGPIYKDRVCLFEKENRLGGRIYDVSKDPQSANGPYIAVGGRRVMETQVVLFDLAEELGISLEIPDRM